MDFNYLGYVNRLLMIMKRTPITSFGTTVNSDEYRARTSINDTIQDLALILRIKTRLTTFEITTVAGQRLYTVQKRIIYPFGNLRQKVSKLIIVPMNATIFDQFLPSDESRGTPEEHYLEKVSGVSTQPDSAGEVVYAVSDAGGDTSIVVVQGYDTNDSYVSDEITLTGVTPVASASTFKVIESVSKLQTTGTVSFQNLTASTTYETLSPKETNTRRLIIGLHPIPDSVITVFGRGWIQVPALVNESDLPVGFDNTHINAITAGGIYHFQKYEPSFKRESLQGLKQDYYDEIQKIVAQDVNDGVQYRQRSPYARRTGQFLPLTRNYFR